MSEGRVTVQVTDHIGRVVFHHPQSNSLPSSLLAALAEAVTEAGNNKDVRVIILESEGEKAFCAGASFDELTAISTLEEGKAFFSGFARVINAMRKCPKLIIGRIHNKAVGGGVGLASATDYCFATENASVKLSELAVGIGPFVVGPAVERKVGLSGMSQMAIDAASWHTAEWARQHGLYQRVFASIAEMDEAIMTLATTLSKSSPEAMEALKRVCWQGTDHWETLLYERAEISGRLVLSDFTRNAIAAFKASR
ncbi:MAG: enoyl-CoA hydratase/isomerase family protein [Flavobacteriales bacterium]|nr:enoyl-CoA hydratase/isomerase family protein [Flavobacteriales bacterium]